MCSWAFCKFNCLVLFSSEVPSSNVFRNSHVNRYSPIRTRGSFERTTPWKTHALRNPSLRSTKRCYDAASTNRKPLQGNIVSVIYRSKVNDGVIRSGMEPPIYANLAYFLVYIGLIDGDSIGQQPQRSQVNSDLELGHPNLFSLIDFYILFRRDV